MYSQISFLFMILLMICLFVCLLRIITLHSSYDNFTQEIDFSQKLIQTDPYNDTASLPRHEDQQSALPASSSKPPIYIYRNNHSFDHVFVDHISKKKKNRTPITFDADVRVDGSITANNIRLDGAPFVSYNHKTNTINFL